MDEYQKQPELHIGLSLLGILVAMAILIAVSVIGGILFNLLDNMRGLGNDKLQAVFRELIVPYVGGYVSMSAVASWIEKANTRFVFFGFAAVTLILAGVYVGYVAPIADKIGTDFWGMLLAVLSIVVAVAGAYFSVKERL